MPEIVTKKLGEYIGAEVLDVDRDRLLADDDHVQGDPALELSEPDAEAAGGMGVAGAPGAPAGLDSPVGPLVAGVRGDGVLMSSGWTMRRAGP